MDPKLLIVKIVTLLFKESIVQDSATQSNEMVKEMLNAIEIPASGMEFDRYRDALLQLRNTALWMANNSPESQYDRTALLQRIRVNVGEDEGLYFAFEQGMEIIEDRDKLRRQILDAKGELQGLKNQKAVAEILKTASRKVMFEPHGINWGTFVREIHAELEPFTMTTGGFKVDGLVDMVDTNDIASMAEILSRAQEETSSVGIMKVGWQGLTRMLGDHAGLRRGETVVIGALQHNFKSGTANNLCKHLAIYNTPYMRDPEKKPLILRVSTENDATQDIAWMYVNLKENETGVAHSIDGVDPQEAAAYVINRLSVNGYRVMFIRLDPSISTVHALFQAVVTLESEGWELHAVVMDYLSMLNKQGLTGGATGQEIRDMWRRCRNFFSKRGTLFISPHQLSTEAKQLTRDNVKDFVNEIANKGYYDGCRTIDQEVDLELYQHIVIINGLSYLTIRRGKHRKVGITPQKDLYTVLPFNPVGGIRDDINGEDTSMRTPGGPRVASGSEEQPWWETESGGAMV